MADATTEPGLGAGLLAADGAGGGGYPAPDRAAVSLEALGPELERGSEAAKQCARPFRMQLVDPERPGAMKWVEVPAPPVNVEYLVNQRARGVTYADLAVLQREAPAQAAAVWQRLQFTASSELALGQDAARAVEDQHSRPWERARFLALREALVAEWQPRGMTEQLLIDNLTQATVMRARFLALAHHYEEPAEVYEEPQEDETPRVAWERAASELRERALQPPRLTQVEAIDRAMQMAERFDRMAVRAIRALRDLRRQTVFIQNTGGQVNVAEQQQVNNALSPRFCERPLVDQA